LDLALPGRPVDPAVPGLPRLAGLCNLFANKISGWQMHLRWMWHLCCFVVLAVGSEIKYL